MQGIEHPSLGVPGLSHEELPPPPDPPPFQTVTITAGVSDFGDTGYYSTVYGEISGQPLPGFPVLELATRNADYTQVAFVGDCVGTVAGWQPVIPGTTLGELDSDWAFDDTHTTATWASTGAMQEGEPYQVTWEPQPPPA